MRLVMRKILVTSARSAIPTVTVLETVTTLRGQRPIRGQRDSVMEVRVQVAITIETMIEMGDHHLRGVSILVRIVIRITNHTTPGRKRVVKAFEMSDRRVTQGREMVGAMSDENVTAECLWKDPAMSHIDHAMVATKETKEAKATRAKVMVAVVPLEEVLPALMKAKAVNDEIADEVVTDSGPETTKRYTD